MKTMGVREDYEINILNNKHGCVKLYEIMSVTGTGYGHSKQI